MLVVYIAYGKKLIMKMRGKNMYLHYHVIDSGEAGEHLFTQKENIINGVSRVYNRECVLSGTLFYEDRNAEPLKIVRSVSDYKYFCDTKNFDVVCRNTILQTLMVLRGKDLIILVIVIGIVVSVLGAVAGIYMAGQGTEKILQAIATQMPNGLEVP
jgi:hypothetical protein